MDHILFGMKMDRRVKKKIIRMVFRLGYRLVGMKMDRRILKILIKIINDMD